MNVMTYNGYGYGYEDNSYPSYSNYVYDMQAQMGIDQQYKALNAQYETEIHFQKCYGVMGELFVIHDHFRSLVPPTGFKFLDLGCAPGGFSSYLLEDPRCKMGFGVTLPSTAGGFPMRLRRPNYFLQQGDLFELGPSDLVAREVHICICDAQYLRNEVAWDEKYRGVRCRSKQHGVWALLIKQFWLGLTRLEQGGVLIFRFGWRDGPPTDLATIWYKKCTLRLFSLLHDLFKQVKEVKSDYFNALQSSFYVCCSGFDKRKFDNREVAKLFGNLFNHLVTTKISDPSELDILAQVDKIRTAEVDADITNMLDRVEKLRLVHEQSRKWHQQQEDSRDDPRAVVYLSPVPSSMSDDEIAATFSVYGRVKRVDRQGQNEAAIQFALAEQALSAVTALRTKGGLLSQSLRVLGADDQPTAAIQPPYTASPVATTTTSTPTPTTAATSSLCSPAAQDPCPADAQTLNEDCLHF